MARCWLELPRFGSTLTAAQDQDASAETNFSGTRHTLRVSRERFRRRLVFFLASLGGASIVTIACAAWLGSKASEINSELTSATHLIFTLNGELALNNAEGATSAVHGIRNHTAAAKKAAEDPLWTLASAVPGLGLNFSAVAEVARSADDVASLGLAPLVKVYSSLNWEALIPGDSGIDLAPLEDASPSISAAAHAVGSSADRLRQIDTRRLLPQVAEPLTIARDQLQDLTGTLDAAADASKLAPAMLGSQRPRAYLLMIQNNAETRASGGIPGALAVLSVDKGKLSLGSQSSAAAVGAMSPIIPFDSEQQQIYSQRLGKYMQDVNLTPDFPTAASTAQAMWERKSGQRVDGVVSIDPVALGYLLNAIGPVKITEPELIALATTGLPTELTGENVVHTLLSDVYGEIEEPRLQDAYFTGVAQEIFTALSHGRGNTKGLIEGLARAAREGRVSVWSARPDEQSLIGRHALSGSIAGPSVMPSQFGVYFNDGTGAKMDYYVKRTVQLVKECPRGGYGQTTVRIKNTNTAPADAATSLPSYVTGNGVYGVPPGSVETNIVAYGPVQAVVETAKLDGQRTGFAPYLHSNRPVGVLTIRLAPGESRTVEFTFGKIIQHAEPNVVVTPSVQDVKDVTLPTVKAHCG